MSDRCHCQSFHRPCWTCIEKARSLYPPKTLGECKAKFNDAPVRMAMKDLQRVPLCCEVPPIPIDVKIMDSSYLLELSHQIHYRVVNGGTQHEWLDELNNEILRRMQGHSRVL